MDLEWNSSNELRISKSKIKHSSFVLYSLQEKQPNFEYYSYVHNIRLTD